MAHDCDRQAVKWTCICHTVDGFTITDAFSDDNDDDDESIKLVFAHSYSKTVTSVLMKVCSGKQFLVHAGTRMTVDSCVAVPAVSSMWTVHF